jgi:hypothetical protein
MAYDESRDVASMTTVDMICIAFLFLLRPGEFTGTTSDDTPFRLQDMGIYIRDRKLDLFQCSDSDLDAATSMSYTFTTHKNGTREETIVQGRSYTSLCCPIWATVCTTCVLLSHCSAHHHQTKRHDGHIMSCHADQLPSHSGQGAGDQRTITASRRR